MMKHRRSAAKQDITGERTGLKGKWRNIQVQDWSITFGGHQDVTRAPSPRGPSHLVGALLPSGRPV